MTSKQQESGSLELWLAVVRRLAGQPMEGLSLLDLCCNECTGTKELKCQRHIGVDVVDWVTRPRGVDFREMDVMDSFRLWRDREFDLCICSDGIEHLSRRDGLLMLAEMERVARLAIVFTPLGPYMLDEQATHPDAHKSAWVPEDMKGWEAEVYPNWHRALGVGAFFAWKENL